MICSMEEKERKGKRKEKKKKGHQKSIEEGLEPPIFTAEM